LSLVAPTPAQAWTGAAEGPGRRWTRLAERSRGWQQGCRWLAEKRRAGAWTYCSL